MNSRTNKRSTWKIFMVAAGLWALIMLALAIPSLAGDHHFIKPQGKLSTRLEVLSQQPALAGDQALLAQTLSLPVLGPGTLLNDQAGRILTQIRLTCLDDPALNALTATGAIIVHVSANHMTVTARALPGALAGLAALDIVANIKEVPRPEIHRAGVASADVSVPIPNICPTALISEGDSQLMADQARTFFGLNGTGVTVGVLSDSHARLSTPTSADGDVATGDLPGPGNPCGHNSPVLVLQDGSPGDGDEGRAMLQIVHDLAPGAKLAFATAFSGDLAFADNIRALRNNAGCDVIVDDVTYYNEPFFQDGPISVAIREVTTAGSQYYTSAGNSHNADSSGRALSACEAPAYRPMAIPGPVAVTLAGYDSVHDFETISGTPNAYQSLTLSNTGKINLVLQWNEPWYGVVTDLDVFLFDHASGALLASGTDRNTGGAGTQQPYEYLSYINSSGAAKTLDLVIAKYPTGGGGAPRVKYLLSRSPGLTAATYTTDNSTDTFGVTVMGHSGASEAGCIAAVPYDNANAPESYTSRGYPTYYYGPVSGRTPAAALASPDTRPKPDVAATDGTRNTFFGDVSAGFHRFYGTSAAAPHVAAVAALMKQRVNSFGMNLNQTEAMAILKATATDVATGGPTITGNGLIDALSAIGALNFGFSSGGGGCFLDSTLCR